MHILLMGVSRENWLSEAGMYHSSDQKTCDRLRADLQSPLRMPAIDSTFSRSRWSGSLLMEPGRQVCFGACARWYPSSRTSAVSRSGNYHTSGLFLASLVTALWVSLHLTGAYISPHGNSGSYSSFWAFRFSLLVDEAPC